MTVTLNEGKVYALFIKSPSKVGSRWVVARLIVASGHWLRHMHLSALRGLMLALAHSQLKALAQLYRDHSTCRHASRDACVFTVNGRCAGFQRHGGPAADHDDFVPHSCLRLLGSGSEACTAVRACTLVRIAGLSVGGVGLKVHRPVASATRQASAASRTVKDLRAMYHSV